MNHNSAATPKASQKKNQKVRKTPKATSSRPNSAIASADSFFPGLSWPPTSDSNTAHGIRHSLPSLISAAAKLLPTALATIPADCIKSELRTKVDRTIVLTRNTPAVLASVLYPPSYAKHSLLPYLVTCQGGAGKDLVQNLAVQATVWPRMPIVRVDGGEEDQEKNNDEGEEDGEERDEEYHNHDMGIGISHTQPAQPAQQQLETPNNPSPSIPQSTLPKTNLTSPITTTSLTTTTITTTSPIPLPPISSTLPNSFTTTLTNSVSTTPKRPSPHPHSYNGPSLSSKRLKPNPPASFSTTEGGDSPIQIPTINTDSDTESDTDRNTESDTERDGDGSMLIRS